MKAFWSLTLPLALAACGLSSEPKLAIPLPASFPGDPAGRPPVDLTTYWTGFGDLTLDALVAQALTQNFTIQAAADRVRAAAASGASSRAALLPSFSGQASLTASHTNPSNEILLGANNGTESQYGLDLSWTLPLFGRFGATRTQAAGILGTAQAEQQAAQVGIAASVASAYITLRADQQRVALLQTEQRQAQKIADLTSISAGAGMSSDLDVAQAQNAADTIAAQIPASQLAVAGDLIRLAILEGQTSLDPYLATPKPIPAAPHNIPTIVPANLLRLRPQIMEAEAQIVTDAGALGLAKADLYPQLTLGGSLSILNGVKQLNPLSLSEQAVKVTQAEGEPGISIPLLDWGERYENAAGAQATLAASIQDYHEAVVEGVGAVQTALAEISTNTSQLAAARREQQSAARALNAAQTLYGQGLTSLSDVLNAEQTQQTADLAETAAAAAAGTAVVDFYAAIGGGALTPPGAPPAIYGYLLER